MTFKECIEKILAKEELDSPDKRPLYQYQVGTDEYEYLNNAILKRLCVIVSHGLDASEDAVFCKAFVLYVVETISRNGIDFSWCKFEKIMNFHFDENIIGQIVHNGLSYWLRPIIENFDGSSDYIGSLYAETGDIVQTPKMLLNGVMKNTKTHGNYIIPVFLCEYKFDNNKYIEIKNSLRFYFFHCQNKATIEYKMWAALFCLFASKTNKQTWGNFESLIGYAFDQDKLEEFICLGLRDFWGRSLLLNDNIPDYLGSLEAESGNVIKTPKMLLKEHLSVGYNFSSHSYTVRKPKYETLQNSLIFYKNYIFSDFNVDENEKIAWSAAFCLFIAETYKSNISKKKEWSWSHFESLIDCHFNDDIRRNLLYLGLEKFWGGTVNNQNLLSSLGIAEATVKSVSENDININNITEIDSLQPIGLDLYEKELKQKISQKTYPFLGLYGVELTDVIRTVIQNEIANLGEKVDGYIKRLNTHPALFSVYLSKSIADGTGQTVGALTIYPVIADAIGLNQPTIDVEDRENLWRAFRSACKSLSVGVSPRTSGPLFMSDEYLLQAGIPEAFLPDATTKIFNLAKRIGLPSDDPQQFQQWRNTFSDTLVLPFPQTARRSLLLDEDGFYIKKFIELYKTGSVNNPSETENIMLEEINTAKAGGAVILATAKPKLEVPQFIYRNNQIGVLLPSSEKNQTWEITTTDQFQFQSIFKYNTDLNENFIPFEWSPLVLKVEVKNVNSGLNLYFDIWENDFIDRFLLFNESGEIHTGSNNTVGSLQLEIGRYVLFFRFQPAIPHVAVSHHPNIFKSEINLVAGQSIQISNNFAVETHDIATMLWIGKNIRSNEGTEIYASENLQLNINVPNDNKIYQVVLSSDAGNAIPLNVSSLQETFNITDKITQNVWKPCVTRLVAKLKANNTTVARSSLWVWIGLQNVNKRITFEYDKLPNNFNEIESKSFLKNANALTYNPNDQLPYFSFVFNLSNGNILKFTSRKPRIFLQIEDIVNGISTVTPIKIGSIISATHSSQRRLRIFYNLNGNLSLGIFQQDVNFSKHGECVLSLSALLGNVIPGNNILNYSLPNGNDVNLITLVQPSVTGFDIFNNVLTRNIQINYTNPINILRLVFTELSDNKRYIIDVGQTPDVQQLPFGATVHFTAQQINFDNWQHILTLDYQNLVDGVWFLDFETEHFGGEWKRITNSTGHAISVGLPMKNGVLLNNINLLDIFQNNLLLMKLVAEKLSVRYSNQAWQHLNWLEQLWNNLTSNAYQNNQIAPLLELLKIELQEPDSIPNQHVLVKFPQLLAKEALYYKNLDAQGNFLLECLKNINLNNAFVVDALNAQEQHQNHFENKFDLIGDNPAFALAIPLGIANNVQIMNTISNALNWINAPLRPNPNNNIRIDNLNNLEKLISMLAFASRSDAQNANNNYFNQIRTIVQNVNPNIAFIQALTYIFTIGEYLLGFYLLYWEAKL